MGTGAGLHVPTIGKCTGFGEGDDTPTEPATGHSGPEDAPLNDK